MAHGSEPYGSGRRGFADVRGCLVAETVSVQRKCTYIKVAKMLFFPILGLSFHLGAKKFL